MGGLDFRSPFDELSELRAVLTIQEIAELTGLRRETISRARPDRRLRRSTEKAWGDLYAVVTRIRSTNGGDLGQLASILRRPQPRLDGRSIAELLREGKADVVLEQLSPPGTSTVAELEDLRLDPATLAALTPSEAGLGASRSGAGDRRVAELLDADSGLAALLPEIEARIRDHFGADARVDAAVVTDPDEPNGRDRLYLRIRTELSFEVEIDRLAALLDREEALLEPFRDRLTIGTL
ncbi:MAG: hypothetical protein JSS97_15385 [Actinobacteria bacterium]|nr:hypothetical protein [Actinomycetota bacterium]